MSLSMTMRTAFLGTLLALSANSSFGQVLVGPGNAAPDGPSLGATAARSPVEHARVRTADRGAFGFESRKPLPHQIIATPDVQDEMDVIERRSQLMITRDNVVRTAIADSSVIDVVQYSPSEIAVIGLTRGATTLTLWFEGSRDPLIYLVKVVPDPSLEEQRQIDYGKLERKIAEIFPNSKVYLVPLSRKIVVMGQARDAEEAARILEIVRGEYINQFGSLYGPGAIGAGAAVGVGVGGGLGGGVGYGDDVGTGIGNDLFSSFIVNMLEVPGEFQVQLRVRIAELNRQQLRRMGVDWNVLFADGRHFLGSALGGGAGTLTGVFENGEISVLLNWLASNGTIKILSEPTMTVLSGHSASFLSGGEFAVPTIVGIGGAQGQQTTFRGFGTSLIATPTIIDRDLIRMRIVPEFSQVNQANAVGGIPGVDARRIQTTVQLREGQTLAIAGLIARQTSTEVTRVPFLGSIPWLGPAVFNTKRSTEDETELLILVSPEIVRPMEADEVPPVPGFNVTHPSDRELYWHARTEGAPDLQYYQLAPFGRGAGHGIPVGYKLFEPAPASPSYPPQPTHAYQGTPNYPIGPDGGTIVSPPNHGHVPQYGPTPQGQYGPVPAPQPHYGPMPQDPRFAPVPQGGQYGPVPQTLPAGPSHGRYAPSPTGPAAPRDAIDTLQPQPLAPAPAGVPHPGNVGPAPTLRAPSAQRPGPYRTSEAAPPWATGGVRRMNYESPATTRRTTNDPTRSRRFSR